MLDEILCHPAVPATWQYIIEGLDQSLEALSVATAHCETDLSQENATACCAQSVALFGYAIDAHIYIPAAFRERADAVLAALSRACAAVLKAAQAMENVKDRGTVELYARNLSVRYRLVEASRDRSEEVVRQAMDRYAEELERKEPHIVERMRADAREVAALGGYRACG